MGLGLFIAKTLLERTGGRIEFTNSAADDSRIGSGAVVEVTWPRSVLDDASAPGTCGCTAMKWTLKPLP